MPGSDPNRGMGLVARGCSLARDLENEIMTHARRAPLPAPRLREAGSNHENSPGVLVRVTVTKPVSFRVGRLRELLETKNVTE